MSIFVGTANETHLSTADLRCLIAEKLGPSISDTPASAGPPKYDPGNHPHRPPSSSHSEAQSETRPSVGAGKWVTLMGRRRRILFNAS